MKKILQKVVYYCLLCVPFFSGWTLVLYGCCLFEGDRINILSLIVFVGIGMGLVYISGQFYTNLKEPK